ncbi:hypothetical protein [Solimicrobium silvestre]|uniref:Uncharacterized protein n=1 Tax=Solimicrobium silvestre TaxID=2099400 RepID=A0A2S9GXX4_9BURK|nr:hypothetical protein [Solimicrobium silvestre]PRC92577.1 hypothetical protein S2091_2632 [Solimicrobium silvestre]
MLEQTDVRHIKKPYRLFPAQQSSRQEQHRSKQSEHGIERNADESEWKCQQPDQRHENQRQNGDRPTQNKQNAPGNE